MPPTPQSNCASEASSILHLTRGELGDAYVAAMRGERDWAPVRAEFSRRFWAEQEAIASAGGGELRLFPWDRGLEYVRTKAGATYVPPLRSA